MNKRKLLISVLAGIMAAMMLLSLILSIIPTPVSAASSSEIKKQINQMKKDHEALKAQQEDIKNQYEENEDEILNMINQKLLIDQEIFLLYEQIDLINQQLSAYSLLIADKQEELDAAQTHLEELTEQNRDRIRAMEEDGTLSYWSVLFKANSFVDLLDRLNMIEEIAAADQRRLQEMHEAALEVETAQAELQAEKAEIDLVKDELDAAYDALQQKNEEAQALIDQLVAKGVELKDMYAKYQEDEKELLEEIAQKQQEYEEAKEAEWIAYMATYTQPTEAPTDPPSQSGSGSGSGDSGGSSGDSSGDSGGGASEAEPPAATESKKEESGSSSESWLVPCYYVRLSSPFGLRDAPTEGASTDHKGVDLAGPEGTPIYASRSGKVTIAKYSNSAGYYVTINHGDGFSSVYMHMTHYVVSKGDTVSQGQVIGYMGSTGISTGPHLDFRIIRNGLYVNPAHYVSLHA